MAEEEEVPEIELIPKEIKDKFIKVFDIIKTNFLEFYKGVVHLNPIFVIFMALCPALAVTYSLNNAMSMSILTSFVFIFSAVTISLLKDVIQKHIKRVFVMAVTATFTTIAAIALTFYSPSLSKSLGIYVPLIAVNCMLWIRAENYAMKNNVWKTFLDSLGFSAGFSFALILISFVRELIGTAKIIIFESTILDFSNFFNPLSFFILAPGSLLTIGMLLAFFNSAKFIFKKSKSKKN